MTQTNVPELKAVYAQIGYTEPSIECCYNCARSSAHGRSCQWYRLGKVRLTVSRLGRCDSYEAKPAPASFSSEQKPPRLMFLLDESREEVERAHRVPALAWPVGSLNEVVARVMEEAVA